ncbi:MAG: type I DNA topoisomerase [Prolixibacteraceae bacterium]|nr:type I DNA topoisomerase [Prolixibacteraceae bacterium]MBN2648261.1 type I DNA topoisomerase [Prolixibacteraceae bacterium]
MVDNLVIVESPAKAKTIEKFLGKDYLVKSSFGHIRDLEKKEFGVDIENDFKPRYTISPDKKAVVSELKKLSKEAKTVWLASDEDREGEAIAWHLLEALNLDEDKTRRIVFHEITKTAIQEAIKNPRKIDKNLVNAQQARRILDRLVGFEVSPVLWKKVKPQLSAGRVQSVAVRLIVDREREVMNFTATSSYRVNALFMVDDENGKKVALKAELNKRFDNRDEAFKFLEKCKGANYLVDDIVKKPAKRSPAPPFTTSTLQQEASRKLGFSVAQTMSVAQRLYEAGKITYMRTDSVNLSSLAINTAKAKINDFFGEKYSKTRQFKTSSKGAQEAHEAIRPTYMENESVSGIKQEQRLYELIWKRSIASQMSDAQLEKTTVNIGISTSNEKFIASGEIVKFDGFLKVYFESTDDEDDKNNGDTLLPPIQKNDSLLLDSIVAAQRFSQRPPRYTEASLVKKLEEQGIGRPSTYAPIITTIQNRGYVVKEDRPGAEREFVTLTFLNDQIKEQIQKENFGYERSKLFPTDIGMVVNDFLVKNFDLIMDFNFTAKVEEQFDIIAEGKVKWENMLKDFYKPFHQQVEETLEISEKANGERILGTDPQTGKPVSVKIGRYGPLVQLGETGDSDNDNDEKPRFASLQPGMRLETITLEEALDLFKLPRDLGEYEDKKVSAAIGRFGPYIRHDNKFVSIGKDSSPFSITLDEAIELIEAKKEKDRKAVIKTFDEEPELRVLNGRWGPYISFNKKNYKIPKGTEAENLSLEDCRKIIEEGPAPKKGKRKKK